MPLMKKRAKKEDKFSVREVSVLIEDLRSQFRVFGEGLRDVREKLDTVTGIVAENSENITLLRIGVSATKDELVKVNGKLARIEESIRFIKDKLKSKVDRKNFELLEKKVTSLTT